MLSTEQQQVKLETLLERVQRNRSKLGTTPTATAPAPPPEAIAPSGLDAAPTEPVISRSGEQPSLALESTPSLDLEVSESDSLELDLESPVEDIDGMEIDLSSADELPVNDVAEAASSPAPPSAIAEAPLETPATISEPSPIKKTPPTPVEEDLVTTPLPSDVTASEEPYDDEPEIEVSYGTEEALALQAELGLGDEDDLVDMDTIVTPDDQAASDGPAAMAFDDLPAPAAQSELEELLTPSTEPSAPQPPPPSEKAVDAPLTQPDGRGPAKPRTKVRAKTVEDLSGPLIELALDEKAKEQKQADALPDDIPTPKPEASAPSFDDLADALTPLAKPVAQPAAKPAAKPAAQPAAKPAAKPAPEPKQAMPSTQAYAAEKLPSGETGVGEFLGAVPTPRVTSFGELITRALNVGKK